MRNLYTLLFSIVIGSSSFAQTVYNISEDTRTSNLPFPLMCSNCVINIASTATLTVNSDVYLQNTSFTGGNIEVNNKKLTFWSNGSFNGTRLSFKGNNAQLINSGQVTFNNAEALFYNKSQAIVYASMQLNSSKMKFMDNSGMEATGGNFELKSASALIAGDGDADSRSYIKFNGATLYTHDQSYISLGNYNNYYYNWSSYRTLPNNVQINTLNNNLNCGSGKNACGNPNLYGPSSLSISGISSAATLPVKLSAFSLKPSQNSVVVKWKTDMETNSDRFIIQRSSDGVYWQNAGEVKAKGNSATATEYVFNDTRPTSTVVYYRLKMLDIDKFYEFSPIKSTTLGLHYSVLIYPNPAREYVNITSDGSTDLLQGLILSDRGTLVQKFEGKQQVKLDLTGYAPGSYFVRVTTDSMDFTNYKLIVTK